MDNRKKKKAKNERPMGGYTPRHISFDEVAVPQVNEPMPVCSICGKNIETIADAISEADGSFSHFDCVIAKIREQEKVSENETVSYIGHGSFAVLYKDEDGKFVIKTRIQYESKESYDAMKKYVEGTKI